MLIKLGPGIYDDGDGGLHVDVEELLLASGWPATRENIEALVEAAVAIAGQTGVGEIEVIQKHPGQPLDPERN